MAKPVIKLNNMFKAEKEDDGSTIEKLKYFSGYTTAHGFGRLVESKSYVCKVFWVMACLGAFTMFSCQVVWLAQDYISKPVETYITLKHVKDIDFPVVTICNHNIIRRNEISSNKSSFLQQFLRDFLNSLKNTTSQEAMPERDGPQKQQEESQVDDRNHKSNYSIQLSSIASASTAHAQPSASISVVSAPTPSARSRKRTKQKRKKAASTISSPTATETQEKKKKKTGKNDKKAKEAKGDKYNKQEQLDKDDKQDQDEKEPLLNEYVVMQNRLHFALANWPEEELSKLGHQFKDMIRECTFKGRSCAKKNFWTGFWHYTYGNCFSFNQKKGLRAGGPGPGNGLLLEINVEQNEYDGYLTRNAGVRVHIGKPGKVPFPYEKGFSVGPGTSTSVGMRKIQIKRVDPFKNGSCMGEKGLARDNLYRLKYNATYSTTACREGCLSDRQMEICNCREYRFPKDARKNERVCDVLNATVGFRIATNETAKRERGTYNDDATSKCLAGVIKKYRKSNLACTRKCPSPCNEDVFKLTISTSKFPSLAYENIIRADSRILRKANIPPDQISSYLLQLNVFFEELNYEVIEENIGYGLVNFISDIGGNMGMWIGISVLTCAEILELLCIMVHHAIKRCAKQQTKVKPMK